MTAPTPDIVTRYLDAADSRDSAACAACFTETGTVVDEGKTYRGRDEIFDWREATLSRFTYTTTVAGSEAVSDSEYRVKVLVEGDFPGGIAKLTFDFTLEDGQISQLSIVE